mmetsp:Transcript_8546/g.14199  ORF Transcript_8546/g.14199 Transcript_8546/m.14199 type:complete len:213 (-) Transcript_8546:414-1052(-)
MPLVPPMPRPPVSPDPRPSTTLPSLSLTTDPDLPIFTDRAETTSRTEETSEPVSTSLTPERTSTSESVSMPWDPSLTELLTTVFSRLPDPLSLSSLTTSVLLSELPPLPNSVPFLTSLPTTLSELVKMVLPISLLRPSLVSVSSPTLMSTAQLMPRRPLPPWSTPSPVRMDLPPLSSLARTLTRTLTWITWNVVKVPLREDTSPRRKLRTLM